ncbi:hypothetical protein [Roseomonas populi]|uniref:Uncharacterized protein n=1 Tax=Roseomonas populi TaxID=3121582 RepID=A0ABT1X9E0_9PROT|nr:hypothetical protein [Roseomonas pecuniae]MCR0984726.1 hypothetical protein [Roseomonas pecuniae]
MNASTKRRAPWMGIVLATLAALPALAQGPAPSSMPPGALGNPVPVGNVTGQPERDTIGFPFNQTCTLRPILSSTPQAVGEVTGLAERDTYGFLVEGEIPCPRDGGTP